MKQLPTFSLLKLGISEANNICGMPRCLLGRYIPFLRLYRKGFVEVQSSRPKKFRAVNPDLALDSFFEKRKSEFEREIEVLKSFVEDAKQALRSVPAQKLKNEVFWTTAITEH